jgi:penicillin-binding protein 1C
MELIYPQTSSRIYIPVGLDGKRSRVVLNAVHRDPAAVLYWHLDDQYLGETKIFHEREASLDVGIHKLMVMDKSGYKLERRFRVIGNDHE